MTVPLTCTLIYSLKENVRIFYKLLTYYVCDIRGKLEFYLFYYNAIFKDRVLLSRLSRALKLTSLQSKTMSF